MTLEEYEAMMAEKRAGLNKAAATREVDPESLKGLKALTKVGRALGWGWGWMGWAGRAWRGNAVGWAGARSPCDGLACCLPAASTPAECWALCSRLG
jgi:hypothetical protein